MYQNNIEEIRHACMLKFNTKRENQAILLMITDGEKQHYLAIKKLSELLRGITSNHKRDFYCLNCFHSYRERKLLKSIIMYVKIMIIFICLKKTIKYGEK